MRSFNIGSFENDDGWFRVGPVAVTTTVLVTALGLLSFFIYAVEGANGPILRGLALIPSKVFGGQIWRLVTWPIPEPDPNIWAFLTLAFFFIFGSQLERMMGRIKYTGYIATLVVLPAVITLFVELVVNPDFGTFGLAGIRFLELAVLAGFVTAMPQLKFFGSIPGWVIIAVIVGLDLLRYTGNRAAMFVLFTLLIMATAVIGIRSMGFSEHDETSWIPKVPLPPSMGGNPYRKADAARKAAAKGKPKKSRSRGKSHLKALSDLPPGPPINREQERDMDALLDKVADQGLDSLTPEQRRQLEDYSKRLRKRDN